MCVILSAMMAGKVLSVPDVAAFIVGFVGKPCFHRGIAKIVIRDGVGGTVRRVVSLFLVGFIAHGSLLIIDAVVARVAHAAVPLKLLEGANKVKIRLCCLARVRLVMKLFWCMRSSSGPSWMLPRRYPVRSRWRRRCFEIRQK